MLIRRRLIRILDSRRTVRSRLTRRATLILLMMALVVLPYVKIPEASPLILPNVNGVPPNFRRAMSRNCMLWAVRSFTMIVSDRQARHGRPVLAVAYSPDGRLIASAGEDAAIIVYATWPPARNLGPIGRPSRRCDMSRVQP